MPRRPPAILRPRIRATRGATILIGPGKADLLEALRDTGSIRSAARKIGMSYMRAWSLVRTMNEVFRQPLVVRARGGAHHGSTHLTPLGERVLALYRDMESRAADAIAAPWEEIERELK